MRKIIFYEERMEVSGTQGVTLCHTPIDCSQKKTWSRLTILLCPVRKGPPRLTSPVFKKNKSFCIHWQTRHSLRVLEGCHTKPHWMCDQPDLTGLSKADVLWSKNCGARSSSNSMTRRVLVGCMTWSTCPSVARLSTSSRPWIKGASVITQNQKCMVFSWREDFSKTRILRNGLEGEVGLVDEDRHVDATNGICALVEKKVSSRRFKTRLVGLVRSSFLFGLFLNFSRVVALWDFASLLPEKCPFSSFVHCLFEITRFSHQLLSCYLLVNLLISSHCFS